MKLHDKLSREPDNVATREAQTLAKANEAIAIRPKRGKLTLLSRRIYNALLYHAQKQGVDEPTYKLALTDLISDARFTSNNTELLKSHLRDMQATTIEWSTSSAGTKKWLSTQLIGTVTIEEPGRGLTCFISWRYPEEIRERLLKPNQYTKVLLEMSAKMRSYSASVLYEIGARYLTSPTRLSMREPIIWWASVLSGRSDIEDVEYRFFKRDIINKALIEVESLSEDFNLELIEHKQGRKVEEIQFRVIPKSHQILGGMNEHNRKVFDLELVGRLIAIGMKQSDAQDIFATTDEGNLKNAIDVVEQRQQNHTLSELKSPVAYFRDALKKGYTIPKEADQGRVGQKDDGNRSVESKLTREGRMERIRDAWNLDNLNNAKSLFNEMLEIQKTESIALFEKDKLNTMPMPIVKAWKRDGVQSKIAASSFFRWLAQTTWNQDISDEKLIEFALSKGILKFN
jgi:plasmid replication initiation protein